jgi:hypothetical protein
MSLEDPWHSLHAVHPPKNVWKCVIRLKRRNVNDGDRALSRVKGEQNDKGR